MTGDELKSKIKASGISLKEVADALGMSQQNLQGRLNVQNVKIGFIQEIEDAIKRCGHVSNINFNGDHSPNVMQNVSGDAAVWKRLYEEKCKELESLNKRFDQFVELIKKQE